MNIASIPYRVEATRRPMHQTETRGLLVPYEEVYRSIRIR